MEDSSLSAEQSPVEDLTDAVQNAASSLRVQRNASSHLDTEIGHLDNGVNSFLPTLEDRRRQLCLDLIEQYVRRIRCGGTTS